MQTFKLVIEAESPDGELIKQETAVKVHCAHSMGVSLLANLFRQNDDLRKMATEAMIWCLSGEPIGEEIDEKDFKDRSRDPEL